MTDKLKSKALEVVSAIRSINRSRAHQVDVSGDDSPCYWQRDKWIKWMLELASELEVEAKAEKVVKNQTEANNDTEI